MHNHATTIIKLQTLKQNLHTWKNKRAIIFYLECGYFLVVNQNYQQISHGGKCSPHDLLLISKLYVHVLVLH